MKNISVDGEKIMKKLDEFMKDNYYPRTPPWWMAVIPCAFLFMFVLLLYVLVWS
jgi:hypothetical protein